MWLKKALGLVDDTKADVKSRRQLKVVLHPLIKHLMSCRPDSLFVLACSFLNAQSFTGTHVGFITPTDDREDVIPDIAGMVYMRQHLKG